MKSDRVMNFRIRSKPELLKRLKVLDSDFS